MNVANLFTCKAKARKYFHLDKEISPVFLWFSCFHVNFELRIPWKMYLTGILYFEIVAYTYIRTDMAEILKLLSLALLTCCTSQQFSVNTHHPLPSQLLSSFKKTYCCKLPCRHLYHRTVFVSQCTVCSSRTTTHV